ncbi:hypothetical protein O9G_000225 [Rozella allomycis CSF55]|uniref:Uncharacterized protein n=1 Tax=Rozella allomycis (strain CSF55) TaxID=988480 RepID=A0A075ASQ7_ROZAC|nr:hypothetical protein O9G_000225 [Rozella allomycis CSF55]|eukprot:EPZ31746.1 hypothetical protein O9G_000225 [Rozella allomycis CSF55]
MAFKYQNSLLINVIESPEAECIALTIKHLLFHDLPSNEFVQLIEDHDGIEFWVTILRTRVGHATLKIVSEIILRYAYATAKFIRGLELSDKCLFVFLQYLDKFSLHYLLSLWAFEKRNYIEALSKILEPEFSKEGIPIDEYLSIMPFCFFKIP